MLRMQPSVFCGRTSELEHLKQAWSTTIETQCPQLVALLAEAGLGKTRLVQEFYKAVSQQTRSEDRQGYWPETLSQEGQNLKVNPDIQRVDAKQVMPFLWWGLRLLDPTGQNQLFSSAVSNHIEDLKPHLQPMHVARRRKQLWLESGKVAGSAAVGFIPFVGIFLGIGQAAFDLEQIRRDAKQNRVLQPQEAQASEQKSLNERIISDLSTLFKPDKKAASIPMIWVIDDAQFSEADPGLLELFKLVLQRAQSNSWPLLIIVTYWEKEWHEHFTRGQATVARHIKDHYLQHNPDWQSTRLLALPDEDLGPMLLQRLPGLTPAQRASILQRVDGNPRFLEQLILLSLDEPQFFQDYDQQSALTDEGLKELLAEAVDLHSAVRKRLAKTPEPVRQAISLSSLQGMRLLRLVSQKLAEKLISKGKTQVQTLTSADFILAENPFAFLNNLNDHLSEFSQRVFYEVAQQGIRRIAPEAEAEAALLEVLRDLGQTESSALNATEQELLLELTAALLSQSPLETDRNLALNAYSQLCQQNYASYDFTAAYQAALAISKGLRENKWQLNQLDFSQLWDVQSALTKMGNLSAALPIIHAMQANAEAENHQRNLSVSHNFLGDILRAQGDLPEALKQYQAGLEIRQVLEKQLGTPETKQDLAVSCSKFVQIFQAEGLKDEMCQFIKAGLNYALEYRKLMPYQDAAAVVNWFQSQLGQCA